MGNNWAYMQFQMVVIAIYNHGKLDLKLLDELGNVYRDMDIDSGGDTGLLSNDGKSLEEVCIAIVDPDWVPVKDPTKQYDDPERWAEDERYDKWSSITDDRWGWR